ncbi:MAG: MBL fold metallo-hydrolase [Clostridiales bacterium]|nr:MBL fold metallo-hydrolase [Clostridiales bacterium]
MKRQWKYTLAIMCCFILLATMLAACSVTMMVKVTFDPNYDGAQLQTKTVAQGTIVVPPSLTREGFTLEGWYKDANCTQPIAESGYKVVNSITFYAKWTDNTPAPDPVVLQGISATYNGAKLLTGDTLAKGNISVTATYSDGSSKAVTAFTVGECDTSTVGDKTVTVSYTEDEVTKTDDITVTVIARLERIEAVYTGGDVVVGLYLDDTTITVTAYYSDGSNKNVNGYTLSNKVFNDVGQQTVTVTYVENGVTKTATFSVNVIAATLERIEAVYKGGKVMIGTQPDRNKLVVTAYYNNGTSKTVTNITLPATIDTSTEGQKDWEISYTDNGVTKSVIIKITVAEIKEPQEADYDVNIIKNENLSIHFLMLGNRYTGDSVYIKAGDTDILIDAGSRKDSATAISNYIDQYCTDGILEYVIVTHAHQDHIAGFVGNSNKGIFDRYKCETIIDFAQTSYKGSKETQILKDYYTKRNNEVSSDNANHYTALECINNSNGAQKIYELADGITMEILEHKYYHSASSNENDNSVCLMISQGDNHYLFTGDLEEAGEKSLVECNPDLPEMELYKGGHHGSYTAASTELMSKIQPKCICICTCIGSSEYTNDNKHQFPAQEFIDRIAPYTDKVYVTTNGTNYSSGNFEPANGNIVFACTNGQITMYFSNNNIKLKDTDWFKEYRTCPAAWQE